MVGLMYEIVYRCFFLCHFLDKIIMNSIISSQEQQCQSRKDCQDYEC